jgi:predicted DNA-binding transcriptional regulator YafY
MRASRLLELLLLLQVRGRMTAPQLAEALEVSVRTVYRDVDALAEAGVPVFTETGRNGGVRRCAGDHR